MNEVKTRCSFVFNYKLEKCKNIKQVTEKKKKKLRRESDLYIIPKLSLLSLFLPNERTPATIAGTSPVKKESFSKNHSKNKKAPA